jgi:uncharacterized Zn finger protein
MYNGGIANLLYNHTGGYKMTERTEEIYCAGCEARQEATVTREPDEWPIYFHECTECGHITTESEWTTVDDDIDETVARHDKLVYEMSCLQ